MSMYDLKRYKEAKALLPEIQKILQVLTLTERALSFYGHFIPVYKILIVIKNERYVLESYKEIYTNIVNNKGEKK